MSGRDFGGADHLNERALAFEQPALAPLWPFAHVQLAESATAAEATAPAGQEISSRDAGKVPDDLAAERTHARLYEIELRQRQVLEAALHSVPLGIAILDSQGLMVKFANRAFAQYLEDPMPASEAVGQELRCLMPHAQQSGLAEIINKVLTTGRPCSDLRYVYNGRGQNTRYWRFSIQPLVGEDGGIGDLLLQVEDITQQIRPQKWLGPLADNTQGVPRVRLSGPRA